MVHFEELRRELEEIVGRLERGDVAVDEAIELFRRGEEVYRCASSDCKAPSCGSRSSASEAGTDTVPPVVYESRHVQADSSAPS